VVTACKNLKNVERDFRSIKSGDLDMRPVFHHLEEHVQAHMLICMLAAYLTWQPALGLGAADLSPAPPYHSFRGLLKHLSALTRNGVRFPGTNATVPMLAARVGVMGRLL